MRKRRVLALPYLGVHSYRHSEASNYDPGARLGVLIGGRINDFLSLDAELSLNVSNVHDVPLRTTNFSERGMDVALSPLVQIPAGRTEIVLGPKLGLFRVDTHLTSYLLGSSSGTDQEVTGYVAGLNAGLFVPVTPRTSLGMLLSYEQWWAQHYCTRSTGVAEQCGSPSGAPTVKILGLTGAALF